MIANPRALVLTVIAITGGLIVLLGYFFPVFSELRAVLMDWAMILAAVLVLVGVINLLRTHWKKIKLGHKEGGYSLILVVSLVITLLVTLPLGPTSAWSMWLYNHVMVPIESSLMGVLAVVLIYACIRMFNQRLGIFSLIFIATVLLALLGSVSFPWIDLSPLQGFKNWVSNVLTVAGARGILLGVGLGTVATGLRILIGVDRPYGE